MRLPILAAVSALGTFAVTAPLAAQRLVTTTWLAAHLHDPDLVILQVGPAELYAKGHIPGARQTDLRQLSANVMVHGDQAVMTDSTPLSLEMLPPDVLRSRLASLGIDERSHVILYATTPDYSPSTTRAFFTLRVAGLVDHASMLDGGLGVWQKEQRPVTTSVPVVTPRTLTATPVPSLVVDRDWVRTHLRSTGILLVDARDRSFYDGVEQGGSRFGHIPTAHSIPYTDVFDDQGKLKPVTALRAMFHTAGAQPGDTVVAYCHIGQQATAVLFAADVAGYPVRLYDGSYEDWSRHKELPVDNPSGQ